MAEEQKTSTVYHHVSSETSCTYKSVICKNYQKTSPSMETV